MPETNTEVLDGAIQQIANDLPTSFTLVHSDSRLAIWTDGTRHGGAVAGPLDKQVVNTIAGKYGLGLREAWRDDGVHLLSFCKLEGSDFR